jgi:hypothetical protein
MNQEDLDVRVGDIINRHLTLKEVLLKNTLPDKYDVTIYTDYDILKSPTPFGKMKRSVIDKTYRYQLLGLNNEQNGMIQAINENEIHIPFRASSIPGGLVIDSYFVLNLKERDIGLDMLIPMMDKTLYQKLNNISENKIERVNKFKMKIINKYLTNIKIKLQHRYNELTDPIKNYNQRYTNFFLVEIIENQMKDGKTDYERTFKKALLNMPLKNCTNDHYVYIDNLQYKVREGVFKPFIFENTKNIQHTIDLDDIGVETNSYQLPVAIPTNKPPLLHVGSRELEYSGNIPIFLQEDGFVIDVDPYQVNARQPMSRVTGQRTIGGRKRAKKRTMKRRAKKRTMKRRGKTKRAK